MAPSDKGIVGGREQQQPPWRLRMLWEKKGPAEVRPTSAFVQPVKKRVVYEHPFLHDTLFREEADAAAAANASTSSLAAWKALLLTRRRLQLDPAQHLYFLCECGSGFWPFSPF